MTTSHDWITPLQHLLEALSCQGDAHLNEMTTDLQQTATLLAETIDKLGRAFAGIHESVSAQHALIGTLSTGQTLPPALQESLTSLRRQYQIHLDAAVTGLQFQDMTGQLIGRIVGHAASLQTLLDALGEGAAALAPGVGPGSPPATHPDGTLPTAVTLVALTTLATVNRTLDAQGASVHSGVRKSVAQTHMDSGDIELF